MAKGFLRKMFGPQPSMVEPVRVRATADYRLTSRSRGSRANRVVKHPQGK